MIRVPVSLIRRRWVRRILLLVPLLLPACRGGGDPVASAPHVAFVDGKVAHFDSLQATLKMYNFSWFPRDETFTPVPNTTFVTTLVMVENTSSSAMHYTAQSFSWRTLLLGKPGEGPLWTTILGGRAPRLNDGTLLPGESVEGWLTFPVPSDEYGDELVWRPAPGVSLAIPIPLSLASPRFEHHGLIFGRVTDPLGRAVPGAEVELTLLRETCEGDLIGVGRTESDAAGWYQGSLQTPDGDTLCLDLRVIPPPDSGLAEGRVRDRNICPAQPAPDREPPELRVDVTLPRREGGA